MGVELQGAISLLPPDQQQLAKAAFAAMRDRNVSAEDALHATEAMVRAGVPIDQTDLDGSLLSTILGEYKQEPGERLRGDGDRLQTIVDGLLLMGARVSPGIARRGVETNRSGVVHSLLRGYSGDTQMLPLAEAANYCNPDVVRELLQRNAPVNRMSDDLRRPLHRAVLSEASPEDIAQTAHLLLSYGADPNARDQFGRTPLHYGVNKGIDVVQALCTGGADVLARDDLGNLPSHALMADITRRLTEEQKQDIADHGESSATKIEGTLPAKTYGPMDAQVFHYLLSRARTQEERNLILNGRNIDHKTPYDLALAANRDDGLRLLQDEGLTPETLKKFETPKWELPSDDTQDTSQDKPSADMHRALEQYHALVLPAALESPQLMALKPAATPEIDINSTRGR